MAPVDHWYCSVCSIRYPVGRSWLILYYLLYFRFRKGYTYQVHKDIASLTCMWGKMEVIEAKFVAYNVSKLLEDNTLTPTCFHSMMQVQKTCTITATRNSGQWFIKMEFMYNYVWSN